MKVTIMEARNMSSTRINVELGKRTKKLEELGMSHEEACEFVSEIMNLGIASQELLDEKKKISHD